MASFAELPIAMFTLLAAAFLFAAMRAGARLRRFVAVDPASGASGQLVVGTFALLSLLIGFTFSMALNRNDQRRDLVLEESSAIRALHRTLQSLDDADRVPATVALHDYARGRLAFAEARAFNQEAVAERLARQREALNSIVSRLAARDEVKGIVQIQAAATRVLDSGARMEMISLAHVPLRVYLMLVIFSTSCAAMIGMSLADRLQALWLPAVLWCALVSIALATIVDLDAPHWGDIRLNAKPLQYAVRATTPDGVSAAGTASEQIG